MILPRVESILWDTGKDYEVPGKDGSSKSSSSVCFEVQCIITFTNATTSI